MKTWMYRFANVVGENATHGAVHDFINRLLQNPKELKILGNGKQAKPYLYVKDCVDGMLYGYEHSAEVVNYFNLGTEGATSVDRIADLVVEEMGLSGVQYNYTGGDRGWKSDVPQVRFDISKLTTLGWTARYSADEAVRTAARMIIRQRRG
jgi:UDP-glucose 4-epimerase